jgi:hypothetical protein
MTPFASQLLMAVLIDLPAFGILFLVDLMPLGSSQMTTVSCGILAFLVIDAAILGVELICLSPIQLMIPDALVDAAILIFEAVVDVDAALMIALPLVFRMPGPGQCQAAYG